jgi:predicted TIM-barrel fold metal-dependent hydrolase
MPVIDVHTHVFPPDVAEHAVGSLVERAGLVPFYDGTVAGLLGSMDASGITVSVLQPVATRPEQVEGINDWTASLASDRLIPFGAVHPAFADPEAEIERMVTLGIRGIKLHPEFQDFDPTDPRMHRIYRAAARHGLIILFHAGEDPNFDTTRGVPSTFKRVLADHSELSVVLAHLGGYRVWDEVAEHLLGESVYLDTAYTLGHLPAERFAEIVRGHGTDRVLFGSDGPWADPRVELEELRSLGLSGDELESILWRNAAELLGVPLQRGVDSA